MNLSIRVVFVFLFIKGNYLGKDIGFGYSILVYESGIVYCFIVRKYI